MLSLSAEMSTYFYNSLQYQLLNLSSDMPIEKSL